MIAREVGKLLIPIFHAMDFAVDEDEVPALAVLLAVEVAAVHTNDGHEGYRVAQLSIPITRAGAPSMPCRLSGNAIRVNLGAMLSSRVSIWIIGIPALSQRL